MYIYIRGMGGEPPRAKNLLIPPPLLKFYSLIPSPPNVNSSSY